MQDAINAVFAAWSEKDNDRRRAALAPHLAEDVYYLDPQSPAPLRGVDDISAFFQGFTDNMPDGSARVAAVDGHHDHHRALVDFMKGDTAMMRGQYFIRANAAGKIDQMVGFIGTGEPS